MTARLIPGTYDAPDRRYSQYFGRWAFLDAIRTGVPEAMMDLRNRTDGVHGMALAPAIQAWACDRHLDAPWLILAVSLAVAAWRKNPEWQEYGVIWAAGLGVPIWGVPEGPRYDPTSETRKRFEERMTEYDSKLRERGFVTVGPKTSPEHFLWAARYQATDISITQLAHEVGRQRQSVDVAISDVCALIDLKRRGASRGRPRTRST